MKSSPATIMPSPSVARRRALIQADSANKTPVSDGYSLEKYLTVARQLFGFFREAYANLSLDHAFLYGMRYVDLALSLQKHRDSSNETERHLNAQIEYIVSKLEIIKRKMDEEEVLKLRLTGRMQAQAHAQAHTERQQQQQQQQQQQAPTSNRFRRVRVERYNEYNDGRFLDRKQQQQQQQQQDQPETRGRKAKSKSKFLRLFRPKKTGETVVSSPICQMFAPSSGQIRRSRTTRAEAHFSNAAKATVATSYPPPPPPPPPIYTVEEDRTYEPPITLKLRSVNTPSLRNLSAEAAAPQYECNVPRPPQQSRGRKSGETCQEKKKHRPVAAPPKIYAPPAPKQTFVRASLPQQQSQSPAPPKNETKTSRPIDIHWSPLGFTNDDDEKDGEELLLEEFDRAESPPPPPSSSPPSPPPPPPSLPPSPPPTSCKNSIATRKLSKQCKQHTPRLKPSHSSPSQSQSQSTSTSTSSNGIESKQQPVSISEEFTKNDGLLLSTNHTDRTSIGSCWDSSSTTCWDNDGSKEITEAGSSSSVAASTPRRSYNNNDNNTKERIMTEIEKDLRATHKEDTVDQLQLLIDEIKERVSHVYTGHHHVLESGHVSKETIGEDEDEDAYTEVIVDDEYDAYTEVIVDEEHDAYTEVIYYEEDDEYTEYIVDDDHTEVIVGGEQKLNDEEINGRAEEKRCLENRFGRGTVSGHNAAVDEGDQDLATTNAGDEYDEYTVAEDIAQPLGMKKSEADCKYTYRFDDVEERNLKSTEMVKESVQNKAPKQQTSLESMATPNLLPFRHPQPRLDPLFHEDLDQSVATIAWLNPVIFDDDEITCITMDQCFRRD